jgi:hypothetical protein
MIDLSLAGLIGAIAGTVVAALVYGPLVTSVERVFRLRNPATGTEGGETLGQEIAMLRRAVLAADIIVLGGIGYWLGETIGG